MSQNDIKRKKEERPPNVDESANDATPIAMVAQNKKRSLHLGRRNTSSAASSPKGSTSTRSLSLGFRIRRAFLIGRRAGPTTPVPSWKVSDGSLPDAVHAFDHHNCHSSGKGLPVSARKLAASFWELQEIPFSRGGSTARLGNGQKQHQKEPRSMDNNSSPSDQSMFMRGQFLSPASSHVSKVFQKRLPSQTKFGETQRERCEQDIIPVTTEIAADTSTAKSLVAGNNDISSNLGSAPTKNEFLKVLNHVWVLEEQHASSMSLVNVLRVELDQARSELQELLLNKKFHYKEVENISKRIADERALLREQHEQSVRLAIESVRQDLEDEQKSKQKLELLHKKVERELRHVKKSLARALEDFEREKKARALMEEVCDELAREIGQDKARVEELKRESLKVREEVEEERKMLQMAEVWREERVQMKLLEAKLELEEKNTALDKLRSDLELFLKTKRAGESKDQGNHVSSDTKVDVNTHSLDVVVGQNLADSFHSRDLRDSVLGRNSGDSSQDRQIKQSTLLSGPIVYDSDDDLHSIELNHEPFVRTARCPRQTQETESGESRCLDQHMEESKQSQGSERHRSKQINSEGTGIFNTEKDASGCFSQESQCIEHNIEQGEIREWSQEQRGAESSKFWRCDLDASHTRLYSPEVMGRSPHDRVTRAAGDSSYPLFREAMKSGDRQQGPSKYSLQQSLAASGPLHSRSSMVSSPTRKWKHYSPDMRSKVASEPSMATSLKAKLLEAKQEGQQAQQKHAKKS